MARNEEVIRKLEDAIGRLADAVDEPRQQSHSSVLAYSAAAQQFAEARAWLAASAQPHGGTHLPS